MNDNGALMLLHTHRQAKTCLTTNHNYLQSNLECIQIRQMVEIAVLRNSHVSTILYDNTSTPLRVSWHCHCKVLLD